MFHEAGISRRFIGHLKSLRKLSSAMKLWMSLLPVPVVLCTLLVGPTNEGFLSWFHFEYGSSNFGGNTKFWEGTLKFHVLSFPLSHLCSPHSFLPRLFRSLLLHSLFFLWSVLLFSVVSLLLFSAFSSLLLLWCFSLPCLLYCLSDVPTAVFFCTYLFRTTFKCQLKV